MTRDELYRKRMMFQIYANRNKIPQMQTNANNEPLKHSATNDYLEYRKKVAAGVRMQRENDESNLFNVTAANEQYYQDLMDQNVIIHAGYKPAGTHEYVAVLPDFWGKGKHRYFYTQEEWDSYNKNKAASGQAGAQRGAKEGADAKNKALASAGQKAYADTIKNPLKESYNKAKTDLANKTAANKAQEAFAESQKNNAYNQAQTGRENAIANSKGGSKDDAQDVSNAVKGYNASRKEWEKNSQANPEAQRAQKMMENADKKDAENITDKVRNHNASRKEWEKNSQANPGADRGAKESERANADKQAANQSGSANAAKAEGEAYDEYMKNKKQASNQSGSANAAKAQGEAYDEYKKDLAAREEFRRQGEQDDIHNQNRIKGEADAIGADNAAKDRALKDTVDGIVNSKNPAKEIASNPMYSKYVDLIVSMLDKGVATLGSDGTVHIDKGKNPDAVNVIRGNFGELEALNDSLIKAGITQRSINAALMDEVEKRYKESSKSKIQNAVASFSSNKKGNLNNVANVLQGMKNEKDAKAKSLAANQSGSGNAAAMEGAKQDDYKARKAYEEEEARAKEHDEKDAKNKGKKKYATSVKHFAFEEDEEEITPEQEYLNFRAKVEAGMKHFGLMRGLMTIPVNQGLKNGENLMHAGTNNYGDYYEKIDNYYGPGKARYFKTKDEWDAHQRKLNDDYNKAKEDVAKRDQKIAMQNEWNKNSQANPGAQRGSREYVNGRLANKQNQKDTANKNYYNTQSKANPEQRRGFAESAQGRLTNSNFTPSTTATKFNSTPNMNLYGVDNNAAASVAAANNNYQSLYRNNLLAQAQSGREAAMNNSGSLVAPKSDSIVNRMVQNIGGKLLEAENNSQKDTRNKNAAASGQDAYQDIYRNNLLAQAQSGREAAINNSAPSVYEGTDNYYGPQSGRALEAEFVGKDQDFFNESKAKDAEALQKYIAKELGATKRIIADKARWGKYRTDVKNIVMDQMMDYYGFNNLSDIYKYEGGPEAFFDDLEAAIAKESMRLSEKTT